MKRIFLALLAVVATAASANAQVDIVFSTSDTDVAAGSSLDLVEGTSGSMYVWITNNDQAALDGIGLDFFSSDTSVLEATGHSIANPDSRWLTPTSGELGDLVTDSVAIALIGLGTNGIANDGVATLYSEIQFDATGAAGSSTDLSMAINAFDISINGVGDPASLNLGGGTVNITAVPEPASGLLGLTVLGALVTRRRRRV